MLQLFNTGINCFITRFRWPAVVVLPIVSKPCITLGLLIDGMAETTDPAFTKDIRVYPAFQQYTSHHHAGSMFMIEMPVLPIIPADTYNWNFELSHSVYQAIMSILP